MSAILQALKRSEAERHGQTLAPVDPTVATGPSPRALRVWSGLLAIALLAGGWALGRLPARQVPVVAQESATTAAPPPQREARAAPAATIDGDKRSAKQHAAQAASAPPADESTASPLQDRDAERSAAHPPAALPPSVTGARSASQAPPPPSTVTVDLPPPTPREPPARAQPAQPQGHDVARWLPASDMPPGQQRDLLGSMQINVHVYAAEPEKRFVLVNLKRREEGDVLGEGMRIAEIVPAGVVVEAAGMRYLWPSR